MSEPVLYLQDGVVATITLNRPSVLNAGNRDLLAGLRQALARAGEDDEVGAVVITGSGRAFSAGADLAAGPWWPDGMSTGEGIGWILENWWNPTAKTIATFPKPTVAAVNGVAAGGAVGLALACDLVVAAESACFIEVFGPQLALVPDVGSSWHLPRLVGPARARGLAMLGDRLQARRAAEWGLIWECVPDAELARRAAALATRLAGYDRKAMLAIRAVLDESPFLSLDEALAKEAEVNTRLGDGPGLAEGITAFLEKRRPVF